jgi:hypothetical protein
MPVSILLSLRGEGKLGPANISARRINALRDPCMQRPLAGCHRPIKDLVLIGKLQASASRPPDRRLDSNTLDMLGFHWYHIQGFIWETTVRENRDKFASRATDESQQLAHRIYLLDRVGQTLAKSTAM